MTTGNTPPVGIVARQYVEGVGDERLVRGVVREQVDLDTLTAELLAVVHQTVQSTSVSLRLRPSSSASQDRSSTGASPVWLGSRHQLPGPFVPLCETGCYK
jgi:hypothetical protein